MKGKNNMEDDKKWVPRQGYSLTLEEIHFLFSEYLNNYSGYEQLESKRTVEEIEELRPKFTNIISPRL